MWRVEVTDDYDEWFKGLADDEKAEVRAKIVLLTALGPALKRPHADTLNGSKHANMKELRGRTSHSVLRIAFAFDPARTGILLTAGDKTGVSERKFYKALIDRADALFDEHLERIKHPED